jgi:hypothetical protein
MRFFCVSFLYRVSDLDQYADLRIRVCCEDGVSFLSNLVKYTDFDGGPAKCCLVQAAWMLGRGVFVPWLDGSARQFCWRDDEHGNEY